MKGTSGVSPEQAEVFKEVVGQEGYHVVSINGYWLQMIQGGLSISTRETNNGLLQETLDEICINIDGALRQQA